MTESYKDKSVLVLGCKKCCECTLFLSAGIQRSEAANPDQALEILAGCQIDALITDVKVAGIDWLSIVRNRFPELAIIVKTGFSDGHLVTNTQLGRIATTIIAQPYECEDIPAAVRHVFLRKAISSGTEALNVESETTRTRVLVAEDEPLTRRLLSKQLKTRDYDVTCVEDGAAALEAIESNDFDILLTDIRMPQMDGLELTHKVKKLKPRFPIIVLSAAEDVDTSMEALRAGAYCYVVKPANMEDLSLFMNRAILTNKLERELREKNALLEEELKRSLNELREQADLYVASRMTTVKQLSAKVAHELKNPLNSVSASFYYVRSQIPQETLAAKSKLARHCDVIETQLQRSKDIIEHMLEFAELKITSMAKIQINALLKESIRQTLSAQEKVDVRFELDPALPPVKASESKLRVVFDNLVLNAAKAMKSDGVLTVTTETDGDANVKITFADTGPGLPPSIIHKIFDPFFTTDHGQGTGLGLSICRETVTQFGGAIAAGNAPGGGAVFTITLPQVQHEGVLSQ